jgi:hypothetical protein
MAAQDVQLQLDRNEAFHRAEWKVQRVGWIIWLGIIAAGLAGLLGSGPLSGRTATSEDGSVTVEYDRFARHHHRTLVNVTLRPSSAAGSQLALHIPQSFLERVHIRQIQPDAVRRELAADGALFVFEKDPQAKAVKIAFHIEHESFGTTLGRVGLVGHGSVEFNTFVYP